MSKQILIALIVVLLGFYCEESSTSSKTDLPEVLTKAVTAVTDSSAETGGNIVNDGGAEIQDRGVCWCTGQSPTITNDTTCDGQGDGNFTSFITGLEPETDYSIRAYATNKAGTGYGDIMTFTTEEKTTGTVSDIDGNVYKTIKIGDQWWMAENLKVTHYRNGDEIPKVTNTTEWVNLNSGAYCNYNNDKNNADTYGRLYNWYAVTDSRKIAPQGWHVPTIDEIAELEMHLGLSKSEAENLGWRGTNQGYKLKSKTGWDDNGNGSDEYGFNVKPAGYRDQTGKFVDIGRDTGFWSVTEYNNNLGLNLGFQFDHSDIGRGQNPKHIGVSVRCIKD